MNKLAIFDCDGTLVDSQRNICMAMDEAFVCAGLDPPGRAATLSVIGLSLYEIMGVLLPDADTAEHSMMAERYRATYLDMRTRRMEHEPLYDGIVSALDTLLTQGWLLGVATGKSDRGLQRCLDTHRLTDRFVTLQTADRHPSKPHPSMIETAMAEGGASPKTTVMIGDTSFDMLMARAANVRAIGVSWGYHAAEDLHAAGAHAVAAHPREIMEMI